MFLSVWANHKQQSQCLYITITRLHCHDLQIRLKLNRNKQLVSHKRHNSHYAQSFTDKMYCFGTDMCLNTMILTYSLLRHLRTHSLYTHNSKSDGYLSCQSCVIGYHDCCLVFSGAHLRGNERQLLLYLRLHADQLAWSFSYTQWVSHYVSATSRK